MSCEVIPKVGRHQYIYLAEAYRNENGQPRQRRKPIGKIDPMTGEKVYKPEYLAQLHESSAAAGSLELKDSFSVEDIRKSSIRSYGSFYLYRKIAEHNGMYCEDWLKDTESYPVGPLPSQRISELLLSLPTQGMEAFYGRWYAAHDDREYLALDITSESSYSKLIEDVEWGYNRDHERLPQINLYIDCVENTIVVNGYPLRAVTKIRAWDKDHKVHTHIYYSAKKASGIQEDLYARVALLKQKAVAEPEKCLDDEECRPCVT